MSKNDDGAEILRLCLKNVTQTKSLFINPRRKVSTYAAGAVLLPL
jgi:hypothetical protein